MIETPDTQRPGTFLTTLPGMLTSVAAVVTAVGGLYLGFGGGGSGPAPPIVGSDVNIGRASEIDTGGLSDDVYDTMVDCGDGSDDACVALLDQLAVECADGFGLSCDTLYLVSPVGSDYELYGATCGGRFAEPYVGYCSDL